jgi:hypothetical protein
MSLPRSGVHPTFEIHLEKHLKKTLMFVFGGRPASMENLRPFHDASKVTFLGHLPVEFTLPGEWSEIYMRVDTVAQWEGPNGHEMDLNCTLSLSPLE